MNQKHSLRSSCSAWGLGLLALAATAMAGTPKADDWITEFAGSPIYPSQLGQPGWPGMVTGQSAPKPWGFPERLPYPGAVEHVRVGLQRYVPVVPIYNAKTLVKNFPATELPGVKGDRVIEYAEPIYSVMKYESGRPTGQFNRPVKVVKWDKTHPPIELSLGKLGVGTYAVRLIAATPTENVERASKRLVINFEVNDGLHGEVNPYRKRCAAIDEFYSIVEFFFHAPEAREYKVKLWVDASTVLPVVYLHNLDVHNKLAQLAGKGGKKGPSLYDAAERLAGWREKGTWKPDERTREQRFADDAKIWNSCMAVNAEPSGMWYRPWTEATRIASAMIPPEVKDDGMGIDFFGNDLFWNRPKEFLEALKDPKKNRDHHLVDIGLDYGKSNPGLTRQTAYPAAFEMYEVAYRQPFAALDLAWQYHETGDETKARQAAIRLARLGLQNMTHGPRQTMASYDLIPQVVHGDVAFRAREKEMDYGMRGAYDGLMPSSTPGVCTGSFISSYDYLFTYILNNQELADSLGRFMPWIKTPADVVRFYDTYVLQYYAHQVMTYNAYEDSPTAEWMANVIAVQQDPSICKPWVDWLFRYVWTYPNRPMGLDEIAVNAIGRDGTEYRGSTFYGLGGSFLDPIIRTLGAYRRAGGVMPVDMTDPESFPKARFGASFRRDIMVAGGYAFWIGDVSGPDRPRLSGIPEGKKSPEKIPNNPSRILSEWGGILEAGRESADFRQRRAVGVRVGTGTGHAHNDPLDLQIWAQGVPMCGDGGGRSDAGYGYPGTAWLGNHNTVVAKAATGHRWISSFAPMEGAQYLMARVLNKDLYERQVVLVDVDVSNSYVVDVFRVNGKDNPTYAFHGMPADQFEVNVADQQKGTSAEKFPFMEKFSLTEETKWSGTAPSPLVATWRMRRDPEKIAMLLPAGGRGEFTFPGAERKAMGSDFDEKAPRKFIRMHLLGHAGDEVCGARAVCLNGEPYTNENLYLKSKSATGKTLFPAVFEPYAGEPFLQSVRLLTDEKALEDSLAPVAIEVVLKNGRRDVIYLAPREAGADVVPGVGTFQGECAVVSYDAKGVRQAALVGGTRLEAKGITVTTERAAYTGSIKTMDYRKRAAELSGALPKEAADAVIETGPEERPTSYALTQVDGAKVKFLQGMDFAMSPVEALTAEGKPILRSGIRVIPGMTVTDDRAENFWRFSANATLAELALDGASSSKGRLKVGEALRVWEIGPGDPYRLPVQVNVVRQADGQYKTMGNAPAKVQAGP